MPTDKEIKKKKNYYGLLCQSFQKMKSAREIEHKNKRRVFFNKKGFQTIIHSAQEKIIDIVSETNSNADRSKILFLQFPVGPRLLQEDDKKHILLNQTFAIVAAKQKNNSDDDNTGCNNNNDKKLLQSVLRLSSSSITATEFIRKEVLEHTDFIFARDVRYLSKLIQICNFSKHWRTVLSHAVLFLKRLLNQRRRERRNVSSLPQTPERLTPIEDETLCLFLEEGEDHQHRFDDNIDSDIIRFELCLRDDDDSEQEYDVDIEDSKTSIRVFDWGHAFISDLCNVYRLADAMPDECSQSRTKNLCGPQKHIWYTIHRESQNICATFPRSQDILREIDCRDENYRLFFGPKILSPSNNYQMKTKTSLCLEKNDNNGTYVVFAINIAIPRKQIGHSQEDDNNENMDIHGLNESLLPNKFVLLPQKQ